VPGIPGRVGNHCQHMSGKLTSGNASVLNALSRAAGQHRYKKHCLFLNLSGNHCHSDFMTHLARLNRIQGHILAHNITSTIHSPNHQTSNMSSGRFPLPSEGVKGGKDSKTATATCFCGAVQCLFVRFIPIRRPSSLIIPPKKKPNHQARNSPQPNPA
jgi:hypothetical protein